jgi:hypothetical protein
MQRIQQRNGGTGKRPLMPQSLSIVTASVSGQGSLCRREESPDSPGNPLELAPLPLFLPGNIPDESQELLRQNTTHQ